MNKEEIEDDSIENGSFVELNHLIIEVHPLPNYFDGDETKSEFIYNPRIVMSLNDYSETDAKFIVMPTDILNDCPSCAALQCLTSLISVFRNIHKIAYVYDEDGEQIDEYDMEKLMKESEEMDEEIQNVEKPHRLH